MIKNIIFDLGGVILDIDFDLTIDAFNKLGSTNFSEKYSQYAQLEFFDAFDKGLISTEIFIDEIKKNLSKATTSEQIIDAWNAMILSFPHENIDLLKMIKNKYRSFLLSNTNAIHFPLYTSQLKAKFGIYSLNDLFEKAYYSFTSGMRKPEKAFFELVIKENNLLPEETLFIDDSGQHIDAASKLGIHVLHLKCSGNLAAELKKLLII